MYYRLRVARATAASRHFSLFYFVFGFTLSLAVCDLLSFRFAARPAAAA